MRSRALSFVFLASVCSSVAVWAACGSENGSIFVTPFDAGPDVFSVTPDPTGFVPDNDAGVVVGFPADPIIDGTAPANAKDIFANATFDGAGGPCLMEPEVGAMFPKNWLRPRFKWIATDALKPGNAGDAGGTPQTLFELRLHMEGQSNDLVVYTTNATWTMPREMWDALRLTAETKVTDLTMTVRGGTLVDGKLTNASSGSSGPLHIAPANAPGTIVYWTTASGLADAGKYDPRLKGFRVGEESVHEVLKPSQIPNVAAGPVKCVGCHTSTPDGNFTVSSIRTKSEGDDKNTAIGFGFVDGGAGTPPYLTATAKALFDRPYQAAPSFSAAHFKDGDRYAVTMYRANDDDPFEIIWTDLAATSKTKGEGWGVFARNGDENHAAAATVSHDGTKIVYISTETLDTSGNIVVDGDLFTIPWNDRKGGTATEIPGANQAGSRQFYPAFSPDDALVAYDRAPLRKKKNGENTSSYDDELAELYVIPSGGATRPTRLAANDPPVCSGSKSPGTYNSWPKWSPSVGTDSQGNKYYFIVFSSARNNGTQRFGARLYVTPVVVDTAGNITSYSALYLWNQPETEDNHSPAWDTLLIPDPQVK